MYLQYLKNPLILVFHLQFTIYGLYYIQLGHSFKSGIYVYYIMKKNTARPWRLLRYLEVSELSVTSRHFRDTEEDLRK